MKAPAGTLRTMVYLLFALLVSASLAACGGGGGGGGSTGSTSPGVSGPATVSVSVASAPGFPAGTTFASSTLSPVATAAPKNSPVFDNVFVTVTKLALIPSNGSESPDANGELETANSSQEEGQSGMPGFVTVTLSQPVVIDLLHPSPGDNVNVAMLLNNFSAVPAGEYSKIRVYYSSVVGHKETPTPTDTVFHPTANYHFDVHFVGGNLVIPLTTDPDGGIGFYSVVIKVVGLKYHQAGQSGNVLLRPQVFATVDGSPFEYIVTGEADNVTKNSYDGNFDILTLGGRTIHAAFSGGGTTWAYSDNVLQDPQMVIGRSREIAVPAFQDCAVVSAIGVLDTGGNLQARHITFTFPDFRIGKISTSWSADNTSFRLNLTLDNLVYAIPNKRNPLYTNFRVPPVELVNGYDLIAPIPDNTVKARGYAIPDFNGQGPGLQAFWISIDNNIIEP